MAVLRYPGCNSRVRRAIPGVSRLECSEACVETREISDENCNPACCGAAISLFNCMSLDQPSDLPLPDCVYVRL